MITTIRYDELFHTVSTAHLDVITHASIIHTFTIAGTRSAHVDSSGLAPGAETRLHNT